MKKIKLFMIFLAITLACLFIYARFYPVAKYNETVEGMTAIVDDELADKYAPTIYSTKEYGQPIQMLYRAAKDENSNTYIAYHIFWENETNINSGIKPMLNRLLYTGGLKLQKMMFGPKDIEVIEVKLDADGEVERIQYETAKDYDPSSFSVGHQQIVLENQELIENYVFTVMSWNHLFNATSEKDVDLNKYTKSDLDIAYFSQADWDGYEMFKKTNTMLKKNRAHFDYERQSVE